MRPTFILPALALIACGAPEGDSPTSLTRTGAALTVDYFGDTDVVGMHFEVTPIACDGEEAPDEDPLHFNVDLADNIYPGMVELMERRVDPASRHLGAELFVTLSPGCYDVLAVPASEIADDEWSPSEDCSTASASHVEVFAGETTAVEPLLSQCEGDPVGALDVTVLLNHPPSLSLEIEKTTNYECEPVKVCATVEDVNDDPIEVVWTDNSWAGWYLIEEHEPEIVGFESGHRIWEVCADIVTRWTTEYDLHVEVFDLGVQDGELVRMEDLVETESSSAELAFQLRTNWIEDPLCLNEGGELEYAEGASIERYPGCNYTDAETFYCSGNYPVDDAVAEFLCDDEGGLIEEALYPECPVD